MKEDQRNKESANTPASSDLPKQKRQQQSESAADQIMKPDTRNMTWRTSNVGSKLLSKMGWVDGQAVGKRQRQEVSSAVTVDATAATIAIATSVDDTDNAASNKSGMNVTNNYSSEGLRVMKRQDGLGLGARATSSLELFSQASNSIQHVNEFDTILKQLASSTNTTATANTTRSCSASLVDGKEKKKNKKKKDKSIEKSGTPTTDETAIKVDELDKKTIKKTKRKHNSNNDVNDNSDCTNSEDEDRDTKQRKKAKKKVKNMETKNKSTTIIPTTTTTNNIMTNHKIRRAKFQSKSMQDLKGIFGTTNTIM